MNKTLGKNYCRPDKDVDTTDERLYSALVFTQALAALLKEKTGIVVEVKGDALLIEKMWKKVLVYEMNNMINIRDWTDKSETHGQMIKFVDHLVE